MTRGIIILIIIIPLAFALALIVRLQRRRALRTNLAKWYCFGENVVFDGAPWDLISADYTRGCGERPMTLKQSLDPNNTLYIIYVL